MNRKELSNLDIVSNQDGVWLYVSNLFYPLHNLHHTAERRGRASIPLAEAKLLTTLQDSGDLWLCNGAEVEAAPEPFVITHGHTHIGTAMAVRGGSA